jgi:hypothetical protein
MATQTRFLIRRYTRKELAAWYRCSERTISRWAEHLDLNDRVGNYYSTEHVRKFVEKMGRP